jgi:hypothetical protein
MLLSILQKNWHLRLSFGVFCELTSHIVTIHFHPLRDAPALKQTRFKITSTQPFAAVVTFLRKKLKVREGDSLWCYIDNFAPAPDEGVGGLFNVSYFTISPLKITIVDIH